MAVMRFLVWSGAIVLILWLLVHLLGCVGHGHRIGVLEQSVAGRRLLAWRCEVLESLLGEDCWLHHSEVYKRLGRLMAEACRPVLEEWRLHGVELVLILVVTVVANVLLLSIKENTACILLIVLAIALGSRGNDLNVAMAW